MQPWPVTDWLHDWLTDLMKTKDPKVTASEYNKNSSVDEIASVNFYAERPKIPEIAETTQNNAITPFKVIQGHRFWYQSKAHIRFPISD